LLECLWLIVVVLWTVLALVWLQDDPPSIEPRGFQRLFAPIVVPWVATLIAFVALRVLRHKRTAQPQDRRHFFFAITTVAGGVSLYTFEKSP
jgi:hypothetical protein